MKIFHLSDLHIGLRLLGRDLREDQEYILRRIVDLAGKEKPDAVVIAGDIYDKAVPSAEAVEVFDRFISALSSALPSGCIMLISGNHDSPARINCYRTILARNNVYAIGQPPQEAEDHIEKVRLEDEYGPVDFYLLPFVRPSMVKNITGTSENGNSLSYDECLHRLIERDRPDGSVRSVLVSHQFYLPAGGDASGVERMDSEIRTVGNIDQVKADILSLFDYAALGHIHKPMKVGSDNFRYCGTPLACSVSEAGQEKGIIVAELREKGAPVSTRVLPLVPLRQIRVIRGTLEEVLRSSCGDYVSLQLAGDISETGADIQDRLLSAFPNLLEVRREDELRPDYLSFAEGTDSLPGPMELCRTFLGEMDEETLKILEDVINTVTGGEDR